MGEVFVSHTSDMATFPSGRSFVDAAVDAVIQARRVPVDMRYFSPRDREPAEYCRQRVREADMYVVLVGFRYGSLVPGEDISYTECEFREAAAAGKPRLVFLLDQATPVPSEFVDADPRQIDEFRARLQRSGLITVTFTTPAELELKIFKALGELPVRPGPPSALTPAGMADQIAVAVRRQWEAEVELWRVNDPYTIPVRWEAAAPDVIAGWAAVERAACSAGWPRPDRSRWAPGPAALAGSDIAGVLGRVPTGRLVVLGEPGVGKTILAVRLVLDLLDPTRRAPGGPVPVLVPLASWDPAREHLWDWLERRLFLDHPALRARAPGGKKVRWARALWDAGLLLPVLDGLDEIAGPARGRAVARVNEALRPGVGLVLTARTGSYREAVRGAAGVRLSGAAGIQLCPLSPGVVSDYLRESAGGPDATARWNRVLGALSDPSQPVAQALTTPLMATLARTVYSPPAPRGASSYPRCSREKLGRRFLGPMAYLDPKGE